MKVITAPNKYKSDEERSLFLGGGITNCPDWQSEMIQKLSDTNLTIYNPRRDVFDVTNPNESNIQIEWEYEYLHVSSAVMFWFPEETLCPITLYELGKYTSSSRKVFVGCHPNYLRKFDVIKQLSLSRQDIEVVFSLDDLAEQIKDSLHIDFKWSWCWECNTATVDFGKSNMCCARFYDDPNLEREAMQWMQANKEPDSPTSDEIDKKLVVNLTEEEKLISAIFADLFSYGNYYWLPKQWADKIGHTIPSYEELCEKYDLKPIYDCKTGKQWAEDEQKTLYGIDGWSSMEHFETEEIPWREFCRRRRINKIHHDRWMKELMSKFGDSNVKS